MAKHTISISEDKTSKKIRVVCTCTYNFTGASEESAKWAAGQHLKDVVNQIKPQKSLDDL